MVFIFFMGFHGSGNIPIPIVPWDVWIGRLVQATWVVKEMQKLHHEGIAYRCDARYKPRFERRKLFCKLLMVVGTVSEDGLGVWTLKVRVMFAI